MEARSTDLELPGTGGEFVVLLGQIVLREDQMNLELEVNERQLHSGASCHSAISPPDKLEGKFMLDYYPESLWHYIGGRVCLLEEEELCGPQISIVLVT